jgi:hypothetical protein
VSVQLASSRLGVRSFPFWREEGPAINDRAGNGNTKNQKYFLSFGFLWSHLSFSKERVCRQ